MRIYRQKKFANRILRNRKIRASYDVKIVVPEASAIDVFAYSDQWDWDPVNDLLTSIPFDVRGKYESAEDVVKAIGDAIGYPFNHLKLSDFFFGSGCLELLVGETMVDKTLAKASEEQINLWKQGKLKLYSLGMALELRVEEAKDHVMTEEEARSYGITPEP